jgi:hypothetical protein
MPVRVSRVKGGRYSVRTPGGVKSRGTTKRKAESQVRLLRAVDHGFVPRRRRRRSR